MNFESLLQAAQKFKASDIHILEAQSPYIRINGSLKKVDMPALTHEDLEQVFHEIMTDEAWKEFQENKGADFSLQFKDLNRYRVVVFMFEGKWGAALRLIPLVPFSLAELGMPSVLNQLSLTRYGLILLTGVTGCGKSTTLAAMIQHLNEHETRRIVTIEDPIEFNFQPVKCVFSQRDIGVDVPNFHIGLRQVMRMDPDVILIGEMRDVETIEIAMKASETGHLVFSTLHTTGAMHTMQRIVGYFPMSYHTVLLEQLAMNMKASITQRLVRKKEGGRIAVQEIMVVNTGVQKLIRENRIVELYGVIRGRENGMQLFDQGLADYVRENIITFEEASRHCEDFYALRRYIAGMTSSGDEGGVLAS